MIFAFGMSLIYGMTFAYDITLAWDPTHECIFFTKRLVSQATL